MRFMKRHYHIPARVRFQATVSEEDQARLQRVVLSAVRRAVELSAAETPEIVVADFATPEETRERFSAANYRPNRRTYAVPSFQEGGAPTEVPVEQITFEEEEVEEIMSTLLLHPAGEVAEDRVISGRSPFEGQLIAIFPRWEDVKVRSDRYAIASDLRRAIRWGGYLFGARAFVIIEGPFGRPESRYYVLGTTHALTWAPPAPGTGMPLGGTEVWGVSARYWQSELLDDAGRSYLLRALITADGNTLFPPNPRLVEEFLAEQALAPPERGVIPVAMARRLVFDEIDRLIASGDTEGAARRLAELDANAFALVDWETKARYLQVLVDAWTREPQEVAIVEIIKSIESRSALAAALGRLRQAGIYHKLFADLDSQIWSLLVVVGERFGDPGPITFDFLVELLQQAGLVPRNLQEIAAKIALGPLGPVISPDLLADLEEAARGFVRFLGGSLEAVWMLISEPEKVVEGIAQLVKLAAMVQLAQLGYPPAVQYVANILRSMAQQVVYGLKGAQLLGITGDILRRIKWAIIWEVASWFVGVGEIKAILEGVGITEKVAAIARLLRILRFVGRAEEAELIAGKMQRLARIVSRSSRVLGHEDEVLRMLSHLPEEDVGRLARALERIDVDEAMDLARLEQLLGDEASGTLRKAEALSELASKAGGLTDEIVEALNRLASRGRLAADELAGIVRTVPQGEGARFARAVRAIPEKALGPGGPASGDFLRALAGSPRRMDALLNIGYDSFAAVYRRTGPSAERLDEYQDALPDLEQRLPPDTRATEFRRLLDGLERDDPQAWLTLEDARRARFGGQRLGGLQQVLAGSPRAQAGFDRLVRGGHHSVIDDLVEDVLPHDPALARRRFEQIGDLTDEQAEGLAVIQHLDETGDIGLRTTWGEVLDLDPAWCDDLLELTAQIHRSVDSGLDAALKRGLQGPGTNVQGTLGHLYAARTLQGQFPGARFRFEVPGPSREIDIQMSWSGRTVDVEVKTNLGLEPTINELQIRRDLIRHVGDQFQDMLYRYAPQQAGNLQEVRDAMLSALQHPTVQAALQQWGISMTTAETWLRQRFAQGLVDTFSY